MRFFIATILLCVLAMFLVPAVITALNPAPPPSPQYLAQQEALDLQNQQDWANFWRVARWAILVLLFTAPLLFLAERYGAQALELVKIRMELRRAQDGEFAMLESREVYIDPQTGKKIKMKTRLMPSRLPTGAVRWNPRTGYWEPATGIDPSIEQEVIMARNASHDTAAAIFPNNEAYIKGIVQGTPRLNGSGMRQVMNPARPPLTQPQEPLALPMKPAFRYAPWSGRVRSSCC